MTASRQLSRMHCGVIRFSAAVREERFLQTTRRNLRELLCQIGLRLGAVKRGRMRDALDLVDDRFVDDRIRMSDADGQHSAKGVEVLVPLFIPDVTAFASYQRERLLVVGRDGGKKKFFMFANCLG